MKKLRGSMLTSGDVVYLDLGLPVGREAGFRHPAVVVTNQATLSVTPNVIQVVPMTSTIRRDETEVVVEPDASNGLSATSAAQCHQVRSVGTVRITEVIGNVGPMSLARIRETLGVLLDI